MHSVDETRAALLDAFNECVKDAIIPGIEDAELVKLDADDWELGRIAEKLQAEATVAHRFPAHFNFYLRISENDVLLEEDHHLYEVEFQSCSGDGIRARITSIRNWVVVWEAGITPLKEQTLQMIAREIPGAGPDFVQGATVLLASEMIGPYLDRLAWFTGYPATTI